MDLRPTYAERAAIGSGDIDRARSLNASEGDSTFDEKPMSGTATYTGLLGGHVQEDMENRIEFIADMSALVNFRSNTIDANATNFQLEDDTYVDGQMTITADGFFERPAVPDLIRYQTSFDGDIEIDGEMLTFSGSGTGDFTGDDLDIMGGEAAGEIFRDGAAVGTGGFDFILQR